MLDMQTLNEGRLTQAQRDQYWANGYLCPIPVLTPAEAQDLRKELEEIEAKWLDNGLPLPLNTYKRINSHCVIPMAHRVAACLLYTSPSPRDS